MGTSKVVGREKPAKYRNKKVEFDGIKFDSIKEFERYCVLKAREKEGTINNLTVHPRYKLTCGGSPVKYESGRQATYTADFKYQVPNREWVVEDTKGYDTDASKLRRAVLQAETGIRVVIV
jgi:hypothetical protein